ncbi:hypothetical protein Ae201684P_021409 [Aphanomyces euteiches]|nr:hypothetical protein Ae201684P_021409 [Aphanomyces euteiches]
MEEEWNVMEDLQCLFTEDMRAEPRFGILDLFLDSTDSEGRTNRVIAAATKKKRIRTKVAPEKTAQAKRKREIIDLIHQITVLENQLIEKGRTVPARQGMSTWENAAREEFFAQAKALQKNAQLKRDVSEQTAFIKQITQLLRTRAPKAFRSLDLSGYAWQLCRLPAHTAITIFEKVSFSEPPFQYGKFPKLPPKSEQVILATSLVKQTIIRRGLRLELMFETGINNVVKSYRAGLV